MNETELGSGARLLADGNRVPVLGLGVWQVPDGRVCVDAVRGQIESVYIDMLCAGLVRSSRRCR